MGIGNGNSKHGDKGSNFNYELKNLKGVALTAANTTGVARTPGIIRPTAAGNVNTEATTFYSVSVANVGTTDGTVLSATIKPGEVLNFSGDALNNFFTSFAYDATGTEFLITYIY